MTDALTPAQRAAVPGHIERWLAVGHDTRPADRPAAEAAMADVYRAGGLEPPQQYVWHGSPMAMARATGVGPDKMIYGQHDAGWLARYDFLGRYCGVEAQVSRLQPLMRLAQTCGWCAPLRRVAHMSERPCTLSLEGGRLHSTSGPSIAWPDGTALYHVAGVAVPEEWVNQTDKLDPRVALSDPNIERRAAAAVLIGWRKVLAAFGARELDSERDENYDYGRLLAVDLPDQPDQRFLEVLCPTGRTLVLRVPPDMQTARQANSWTYGLTPDAFHPEGRT